MRITSILGSMLVSVFLVACSHSVDIDAAEAGARGTLDDFWRAISTQDHGLLTRVVANDNSMIAFGTDAAERWIGSATYLEAEKQMMQVFDVTKLNRVEETLRVNSGGDVAWFSTVFDLEIDVGGELSNFKGLRTTGVLEKRNGNWKLVQSHTSVPVSGQQVEY